MNTIMKMKQPNSPDLSGSGKQRKRFGKAALQFLNEKF
jgi:hypothetical protein